MKTNRTLAQMMLRRFMHGAAWAVALAAVLGASIPALATSPGSNGKIVFQQNDSIATMNPDGTSLTIVATPPSQIRYQDPAWSTDGKRIAFVSVNLLSGASSLNVMNADGSGLTVLTSSSNTFLHPTWSPDGTRIAFATLGSISVIDAGGPGTPQTLLSATNAVQPAWSPDGTKIAITVTGNAFGTGHIALINADGTGGLTQLTFGTNDSSPSWSPDGTQIAFVRPSSFQDAIHRIKVDGTGLIKLSNGSDNDDFPSWSPDGISIVFKTNISGNDIWTMSAVDGSARTQLTNCDCANSPDWQTVPPVRAPTTTTLFVSSITALFGQQVTFTATVTPVTSNANVPSGQVTFSDGTTTFSGVSASPGTWTFSITGLGLGSHTITASYGGDGNFSGSTSAPVAVTIVNTRSGIGVSVQPVDAGSGASPVTLTFESVSQPGITTLTISAVGPATPSGFKLGNPPIYYYLTTTAVFSGNIKVCINYSGTSFTQPPQLFHYESGKWVNTTISVDTVNMIACGIVTSLSPFALFAPIPPPAVAPVISGTLGNNGWYVSDVAVSWSVTPLPEITAMAGCQPVTITADSAGTTFTCTASTAGGTTSQSVTIKRNATPPAITVSSTPGPNASGWNNTDVTVSFTASALSGIAAVSGPVTLSSEGANQVVTGMATDLAGISAAVTVTVNIDKTPPEAFIQFDPATQDLQVFGRDALSGMSSDPVAPVSVVPIPGSDDDGEHHGNDDDAEDHAGAELRTYRLEDLAGNTLVLVVLVKKEGHEIKARVVSTQSNGGPVLAAPRNRASFEWDLDEAGLLQELEQKLAVGADAARQEIHAEFKAGENQTIIEQEEPEPEAKSVRPGLVLLRMATDKGRLALEF